jgi:hypothetical protein
MTLGLAFFTRTPHASTLLGSVYLMFFLGLYPRFTMRDKELISIYRNIPYSTEHDLSAVHYMTCATLDHLLLAKSARSLKAFACKTTLILGY